uniref:Bestrophin homolog n=1 Tax=Parascaris equorum TaxID=6256 RepID=A0A914RWM3_PAREQ
VRVQEGEGGHILDVSLNYDSQPLLALFYADCVWKIREVLIFQMLPFITLYYLFAILDVRPHGNRYPTSFCSQTTDQKTPETT